MARWQAFILTQSNRLEVVEFDTPNIVRSDAIAQCKSMYGAKEVKSCNPISDSTSKEAYSSSDSYSSDSSGGGGDAWFDLLGSLTLLVIVVAIILVIAYWQVFVVGGVLFIIYKLAKKNEFS
jgi:hypothetical protein